MELKEFSHKGEAIEKEIKKEFQFMGRTIKKRRVGLIIAAAGVTVWRFRFAGSK